TNGKTTTSRMLGAVLVAAGWQPIHNRSGSNLVRGLVATVVQASSLGGSLPADSALFEVDEATVPAVAAQVRPRLLLINNLFRDQLDRYGELELLARTIHRALEALPEDGRAVLNADDPRVGELGQSLAHKPLWYGIEDTRVSVDELPHAADARTCPRCGQSLSFSAVFVGHDGHYRCPRGDFERPAPEVAGTEIRLDGLDRIGLCAGGTRLEVPLGGLYNAYNLLGAFAVGRSLGLDPQYMATRLATAAPAFGRQERFERDGKRFTIMLAKNPTGFNQILLESERLAGARHFLLGLNDRIADGRDVSWIWDVDFEVLAGRAELVVPSGTRAYDMALRLKYAGVSAAVPPQPDLGRAIDQLIESVPPGGSGHVLCTYTAMLELRALLVRRGWLRPYWAT
ncbi:MAG: DUF1727 domain-containing protein, partial [Candidatus Nephthysia bennettiae]